MPLILLTTLLCFLAMIASWNIEKYVRGYCALFLLLETGMIGTFFALDFFLFYIFWEVMLLPMYFLIGVWGGPRREYAAIKFFLYTLLGSRVHPDRAAWAFTSPTFAISSIRRLKPSRKTRPSPKASVD